MKLLLAKNLHKTEHLPSILVKLANNLNLKLSARNNYFYEVKKKVFFYQKKYLKKLSLNMFLST